MSGIIIGAFSTYKFYCRFKECCNPNWVYNDVTRLISDLDENIFGQPHILDLAKIIIGHSMSKQPNKPLIISLHGPTGTGKNYAASIIANRLFRMGRKSKFIKMFIGSHGFSDELQLNSLKEELLDSIASTVSACPLRSLIIIDEADKLPTGLLDHLRPLMHTHDNVDGVDYRKTIFILISNSGQEVIGKLAFDFASRGKNRAHISLLETEKLLRSYLFNNKDKENSGFYGSSVIGTSEIDKYIAFFPLDKNHVKQCVRSHAQKLNITDVEQCVLEIVDRIEFIPEDLRYFSATGCKKVNIFVDAFC